MKLEREKLVEVMAERIVKITGGHMDGGRELAEAALDALIDALPDVDVTETALKKQNGHYVMTLVGKDKAINFYQQLKEMKR